MVKEMMSSLQPYMEVNINSMENSEKPHIKVMCPVPCAIPTTPPSSCFLLSMSAPLAGQLNMKAT